MNKAKRLRAWEEVPLGQEGILDAKLAAQKIKRYKPKMIYSSDLSRDLATANVIANELDNIPFEVDYGLRTADMGELGGMKEEDAAPIVSRWYQEPWQHAPSGESLNEFLKRYYPAFDLKFNLAKESEAYRPTVIVSHGRNLAAIHARSLMLPQWQAEMPFPGGVMAVYLDELGRQSVEFLSNTEPIIEDR